MRRSSIATTALMSSLLASSLSRADGADGGPQHIYVLGGTDPRVQPKGQVAAFTPPAGPTGNGTWAPVEAFGAIRAGGRAAGLGGYIYHVGGTNREDYPYLNTTLRYSPSAGGAWSNVADLPCDPADPVFCPDSLPGGQPSDDPDGGGLADHAVVSLAGHLYAIGGTNGTTSLASTVRYDPTADKWEFMAQMSIGRCYVGAAVLGGKIYAVGGSATPAGPCNAPSICPKGPGADQPGALNSVEVYDPESDKWSPGTRLNIARSTHAVAACDGMLYALGGEDGGSPAIFYDTVERFDPRKGSWTIIALMSQPRAQVGAGVINGILFAVGGYNDFTDIGWTSSVEAYDSASNSWRGVGPFPLARQYPAVTAF